ncbi:MAG TPA: valine--tRNA ligase, partial [Candidatus Aenigmarchaeota archaeon]|nr:valine--tRNA ligase [Candidatus Aenigmarchaeota archaeon]
MKLKEKRWKKEFEEEIRRMWREKNEYRFDENTKKPVFSIDTPPPYVNAPVHIGQATTYVLMDMFARFRRMIGYEVLFPLGLDRNGLPIEVAAERKFGVKMNEVSRERFVELCKKLLEEYSMKSTETFYIAGISFNSWEIGTRAGDVYLTDMPEYRKLTQETFIDLWNKGLIYEDVRINNYCPGCRTTIADAEIEYDERPTVFNYVKFKVKETGEDIVIATTRPELLCTCKMVVFNPSDERYKHLNGKTAIVPLYNIEVPIRPHPIAKPEMGTGLEMMCSFGDTRDIQFFREMDLQPVIAIDQNGKMNKHAGFLEGLEVLEAREKIVEMLKEKGMIVKQEKMMHRIPICERSKDAIEFIAMPEYYLKQMEFKDKIRAIADKMNFYSPKSKQILLDWIDSIKIDWAISRRRYYATEIPVWYCKKCNHPYVPPKGKYYQPWRERPPIERCPKCGHKEFRGEERVFDTWFDSSITPLFILKYSRDNNFFEKHFPCTLRPQGKEIVRTWLYYTLLKCYLLTNKQAFRDVWINYHILDEKGKKMSKSLGNIIDPQKVMERYGAEPFRFWAAIEGNLEKTDFKCSFNRIEGASKFLTKYWNIARFVSLFDPIKKPKHLVELDKWVIKELNMLIKYTRERYERYDFHGPAVKIKHFLWEVFASHYIEMVKNRAYNQDNKFSKEEQESAIYALHEVLEKVTRMLAPIIPFITYRIYKDIYGKNVHKMQFPSIDKFAIKEELSISSNDIIALNSAIWKVKKDAGMSLKSKVRLLTLPVKFKPIEKDIIFTHNIEKIEYKEGIS